MNLTPIPSRRILRAMLVVFGLTFVVFLVCELLSVWTDDALWDKLSSTALILSMAFFGLTYIYSVWSQPAYVPPLTAEQHLRIQQRLRGITDDDKLDR